MAIKIKHGKKFLFFACISIIVITLAYGLIRKTSMDNKIIPSSLPKEQLWTIEHAEAMQKKGYYLGIPSVQDKAALMALVKQAWQWDKNAMIFYARIIDEERIYPPDEDESFQYFLKTHRSQIVDAEGRLLNEPPVLRLDYAQLMRLLADQKHPYAANYLALSMIGSGGEDEQGNYIPHSREKNNEMLNYIRYSIEGGYRRQSFLANSLLFRTGFGFKNISNDYPLVELKNHAEDLTQEELLEAMENYRFCSEHGSIYCMMRLSEAYYHGIAYEKDLEQAYAWGQLASQAYDYYLEVFSPDLSDQSYKSVNAYNMNLLQNIKQEMTQLQIESAESIKKTIEPTLQWDYDTWASGRDPVPPMP